MSHVTQYQHLFNKNEAEMQTKSKICPSLILPRELRR